MSQYVWEENWWVQLGTLWDWDANGATWLQGLVPTLGPMVNTVNTERILTAINDETGSKQIMHYVGNKTNWCELGESSVEMGSIRYISMTSFRILLNTSLLHI